MSRLNDQIGRYGGQQIKLMTHLLAIVHRDLMILSRFTRRLLALVWSFVLRTARQTQGQLTRLQERRAQAREREYGNAVPARRTDQSETGLPSEDRTPLRTKRVTRVPDQECIYAIGDIHGRYDLLSQLLDKIDADIASLPEDLIVTLVFLGDYIDRGLQSRQVIDLLLSERMANYRTVYLIGNHEEALLQFRDDLYFGQKWARFGGAETLNSYGLHPPRGSSIPAQQAWREIWQQFRETLPEDHLAFYRSLKHYFTVGDYLFVHAGLRPNVPLEDQTVQDMLWIRDEFLTDRSDFPYLVVHGHSPSRQPFLDSRRLGLDTAAYSSGILTAARFVGTEISVIKT